jgi:hypothetical protein
MMWWWSNIKGETMSEDDFFEMLDNGLCAEFVEFLEIVEGKGYYIPFITTASYLTHPASRKSLNIKEKKDEYPN